MGFFKNILKKIIRVSRPIFSMEANELNFKIDSDFFYTHTLENFDLKTRHDPYTLDAFTLKTSNFYVEHIKVDEDTTWQGQALSLYEDFLKEQLKLKKLEVLENNEYEHYVFKVYKVDDEFLLHLIYIWEVNKDVFILDFDTSLFKTLISGLDKNYIYKFNNQKRLNIDFDCSLVKLNAFKSYFNSGM